MKEKNKKGKASDSELLGLSFYRGECDALLAELCRRAKARERTAVFTPNASMAAEALREEKALGLLQSADYLTADGIGISLAARLAGIKPPPRWAGIDLAEALLLRFEREGICVFFYGAAAGVAERAAQRMKRKYPRLLVAGTLDGRTEACVAERAIRESGAGAVFVCLGFPKQESYISRYPHNGVMLALGGTFDVWAKDVRRAPRWMRRVGLEWLWRLMLQPRRLIRLKRVPRYFLAAFRIRFSRKEGAKTAEEAV